jgi:hypothetical protein
MSDLNPYEPAEALDTVYSAGVSDFETTKGPALAIVIGAFVGALVTLPFLFNDNPIGLMGCLPGALFGGLYYRCRSSQCELHATSASKRYAYSILLTIAFPVLAAFGTGLLGQGLHMTILAAYIGFSLALGVLVSGDRRIPKGA